MVPESLYSNNLDFCALEVCAQLADPMCAKIEGFFELQSIEICAHSHTCTETNSEKTRKSLEEVSLDVTTFHRIFALTICCEQYSLCFVHTASNSA